MFVQGDLTHQGSLLCFCCKALKMPCLYCRALKGEPLSHRKYSVVVLTFDFVKGVWKHTCTTSCARQEYQCRFNTSCPPCLVFPLQVLKFGIWEYVNKNQTKLFSSFLSEFPLKGINKGTSYLLRGWFWELDLNFNCAGLPIFNP